MAAGAEVVGAQVAAGVAGGVSSSSSSLFSSSSGLKHLIHDKRGRIYRLKEMSSERSSMKEWSSLVLLANGDPIESNERRGDRGGGTGDGTERSRK